MWHLGTIGATMLATVVFQGITQNIADPGFELRLASGAPNTVTIKKMDVHECMDIFWLRGAAKGNFTVELRAGYNVSRIEFRDTYAGATHGAAEIAANLEGVGQIGGESITVKSISIGQEAAWVVVGATGRPGCGMKVS
jgi:hypothetical protein